jgi:hypothetical protein
MLVLLFWYFRDNWWFKFHSEEEVISWKRWQGLLLRKRVGDHLDFKPFGGYEVLNEEDSLY